MCYNESMGYQIETTVNINDLVRLAADMGLASIEREGYVEIIGSTEILIFKEFNKSEETQ